MLYLKCMLKSHGCLTDENEKCAGIESLAVSHVTAWTFQQHRDSGMCRTQIKLQ